MLHDRSWVSSTLKTNHASKWWCLFYLLFYILHLLIRLQHSIHSRNAKNWLLQKRYRQKGTHWPNILIIYYHVNKLQTHLSYGHYHKYNNYYWSALHNSARLSNGQARVHLWTAVPICDFQTEDVDWIRPLQNSIPDFSGDCHIWKNLKNTGHF